MIELLVFAVVIVLLYLFMRARFNAALAEVRLEYEKTVEDRARGLFEEWKSREVDGLRKTLEEQLRKETEIKFAEWVKRKEVEIREDAIMRSMTTLLGRIGEHIAPLLMATELGFDPRDLRYIGTPVDYVVFKGLSDRDRVEEILFVEVKTGKTSSLSGRERAVKEAVDGRRVRWITYNMREVVDRAATAAKDEVRKLVESQIKESIDTN